MNKMIYYTLSPKYISFQKNEIVLSKCYSSKSEVYWALKKAFESLPALNDLIEIIAISGEKEIIDFRENYDSKKIGIEYLVDVQELCGYRCKFSDLEREENV